MQEVEKKMGADIKLTDAVIKLSEAKKIKDAEEKYGVNLGERRKSL